MGKNDLLVIGGIVGSLVLLLVFAGITGFLVNSNEYTDEPGEHDDFAKALTDSGVKMFGADWCPHCQEQKSMFGNSFQYINYINCETQKRECQINSIASIPVWEINGQKYTGVKSLAQLSELSNVPLE